MVKPCGIVEPCSPRGPCYSGKLIARAVELYLKGVKPGYIRWDELQNTLEKEFPSEFPQVAQDRPSPETVLSWVRKRPDAPERLKNLRVQQASPNSSMNRVPAYSFNYQPSSAMSVSYISTPNRGINTLFSHFMAFLAVALMVRYAYSLSKSANRSHST